MTCLIAPRKAKQATTPSRSQTPDLSDERRQRNSCPDIDHGSVGASNISTISYDWEVVVPSTGPPPTGNNVSIHLGAGNPLSMEDGWPVPTANRIPIEYRPKNSPSGQYPLGRLQNNGYQASGQMTIMPNGGLPMVQGSWFHRSPEQFPGFPDSRFPLPPSPPRGPPLYIGTYPAGLPVFHGHIDYSQMPGVVHDDAQRHYQGMPIEEGFQTYFPHHHIPYNAYQQSEYTNYFQVQPPEPFNDYSFGFDPARPHQGRPQYSLPLRNVPVQVDNPYHPNSQMPHPNHVPETGPHQTRYSFEYTPNQHPQIFFPSAPQILRTPPVLPHTPAVERSTYLHQKNENTLLNNNLHQPSAIARKLLGSNTSSQPKRAIRHSSHSAVERTPTSGNTRLVRRVNNLSHQPRSPLLEEFRNNRDKHWELKDIFGHVVEFSGDQYGSRFIQQKLEEATNKDKEIAFDEIVPSKTDELVRDVFGNYVIQKFFEFGTPSQINILSAVIENQVDQLSLQIYGCRVVQKALESISCEQQSSVIRRLEPHILTCIKDAHGNHVVQKLVEVVAPERLSFLSVICDNILELATHPYGCRVLQRCLEHLPESYTRSLLDAIQHHVNDLMKDQYGNYVIQFILEQGQARDKAGVLSSIRGNVFLLAQHKYASNVCEKALACTDSESRSILINEIMVANPNVAGENPILTMVKDQYANYVLQRALTLSEGEQREAFFNQVKPLLVGLRKSTMTYSRPLVSMERLMEKYFDKQSTTLDCTGDETVPVNTAYRTTPRRSL